MTLQTFILAFVVSYLGSIPPGTINISVMQLSILRKHRAALFFSLAATLVEFCYAGMTIQFQLYLNTHTNTAVYFRVITALVLIVMGLWNMFSSVSPKEVNVDTKLTGRYGFLRGVILGLLNPMTIPFWLAITTYLENDGLVDISGLGFWIYLVGLSSGTFCLLLSVNALGKRFSKIAENKLIVRQLPGATLFGLGAYYILKLALNF